MSSSQKNNKKRADFSSFIIVISIVVAVWYISWELIDSFIIDASERGTFGDKFGAINALFSGFAFAGLIYTINLQLKETERQNFVFKKQQFESNFFNLLNIHHHIVDGAVYKEVIGREAFFLSYSDFAKEAESFLKSKIEEKRNKYPDIKERRLSKITLSLSELEPIYLEYYDSFKIELSHYFRNLYRILKYIDETECLSDDEKYDYVSIIRSQLSDPELLWLFYNGLFRHGGNFVDFICRYSLFNNISDNLIQKKDLKHYHNTAYNKQTHIHGASDSI